MNYARFVAAARQELLAEVRYYNNENSRLGPRFTTAVENAIKLALAFPQVGSPSPGKTRQLLLDGFPFSLVYRIENDGIVIFAIAHHSRRPGYWKSRTTG